MGNILLRLLAFVLVVIMIVLAIGYLLPREFEINASIKIAAPPAEVFDIIDSLPNWQHWSTFSEERIEGLKITYGRTKAGKGAVQSWSDRRGKGKMWITDSQPPELLKYKLKFGDFPEMDSSIRLTPVSDGTRIDWSSTGSLPSGPFYGYSGLLFSGQMTHEYKQNLARLKDFIE